MSHIIQNFGNWKKVNEDDIPRREKEKGTFGNKIVAIPVDRNTLKLKLVHSSDVIDGDGRLTQDGFNALLAWIQSQGEIINYYTALRDLTNNLVVYSIAKDNQRKQVIQFRIFSKAALKMQNPTYPGVNSQVQFVREDELEKALKGDIIRTAAISNITSGQNRGLTGGTDTRGVSGSGGGMTFPIEAASLMNSNNTNIIAFIVLAYNKIKKEPRTAEANLLPKVKAEIQAKKLGPATTAFIKALNAGFGILDAQFREETETAITKLLYDKITYIPESKSFYLGLDAKRIVEAESSVIAGFDIDAFIETAKSTSSADTGDIKVPANGFKEGMQNDPELKKFQDLLVKKLNRNLANHATFQKFKKAGAKGFKGNYGPLTKDLIYLLKAIAENPVYPNRDGSTIEPDFVNMVQRINESSGRSYLGLDGATFVFEDFNFGNANVVSPSSPGGGGGDGRSASRDRGTDQKKEDKGTGKVFGLTTNSTYEYTVKNNVWYARKKGESGQWAIVTNPSSIKQLIKEWFSVVNDGYFILLKKDTVGYTRADDRLYKFKDNKWYVQISGYWKEVPDPSALKKIYGTNPSDTKAKPSDKKGRKLSDDAIKGLAHTLFLAMDGANTYEDEIYGVYKKIKSLQDLAALHAAFKKEPGVGGGTLSYWLYDDFDSTDEWKELFKIIEGNKLLDETTLLKIRLEVAESPGLNGYYEAYKKIYAKAAAVSK